MTTATNRKFDLADWLLMIGLVSILGGVAHWSVASALILFGLVCLAFVYLIQTVKKDQAN